MKPTPRGETQARIMRLERCLLSFIGMVTMSIPDNTSDEEYRAFCRTFEEEIQSMKKDLDWKY